MQGLLTVPKQELTPSLLEDFKEHIVWQVISKRISGERDNSHNKAVDASDARAAGAYRAYEMVLGLPDQLLRELEGKGGVTAKLRSALGR